MLGHGSCSRYSYSTSTDHPPSLTAQQPRSRADRVRCGGALLFALLLSRLIGHKDSASRGRWIWMDPTLLGGSAGAGGWRRLGGDRDLFPGTWRLFFFSPSAASLKLN